MNEFHFHQCPFVNSPCPRPEDNPARHLLPPEPPFNRNHSKENHHSESFEQRNNSRQYVDVTLGNSPEFPSGSEPPRIIKNISYFNNKLGESMKKIINIGPREAVVEVKVRESDSPGSPAKSFNSTIGRNDGHSPYVVTQTKSSRVGDSLMLRSNASPSLNDSYVRHCYKCSPQKEEKELSCHHKNCLKSNSKQAKQTREVAQSHYVNCYKCKQREDSSSTKGRLTNQSSAKEKQLAYEIKVLTQKVAQMVKLENTNRILTTQLQSSREKLKAREAQINVLKSKNNDLTIVVGDLTQQRQYHLHIHDQVHQLRNINQSLLIQIEELKKKVLFHEEKNSESLRLLQKLNDNISQKQLILKRDLDQQTIISNRYLEQKNRIAIELSALVEKIKELEECHGRSQKTIEEQRLQIYQLKQKVGNNKESVYQATIDELRIQITKLETSIKESQNKYNILLQELRSKQEEYSKLQIYSEQLRKEKNDTFLRIEEEKTKISGGYDQSLKELKVKIGEKEEEIQRLLLAIKELEIKWKTLSQENYLLKEELKKVKEEYRILIKENDEIKHDCQQLMTKNQRLFRDIEQCKQKELELNSIISNYQKDIIQIEETITQRLNDINNKDIESRKWRELYQLQKFKNEKLTSEIKEKLQIILNLEENLRKKQQAVLLYKEGLTRLQEKKEVEWTNMNKVYTEQIRRLEETVKELMAYNQNKRMQKFAVYKTTPQSKSIIEQLNNFDHNKTIMSTINSQKTETVQRVIPSTNQTEFREFSLGRRDIPFTSDNQEYITSTNQIKKLSIISETAELVPEKREIPTITFNHHYQEH